MEVGESVKVTIQEKHLEGRAQSVFTCPGALVLRELLNLEHGKVHWVSLQGSTIFNKESPNRNKRFKSSKSMITVKLGDIVTIERIK